MSTPSIMTEPVAATATHSNSNGVLSGEFLRTLRDDFAASSAYRQSQNAVTQTSIEDVALNRAVVTTTDHTFSELLDDWKVTNQKKSGRCWMFAGLNLFRVGAMKKMNLKDFEFSQNYTLFWDKFERANYFLEAIIETASKPVDDRVVAFLLERPLDDGGQWNMFINVIKKHGVVPKTFMPESESSSNTRNMNGVLLYLLRQGARTLRNLKGNGAPMEALQSAKRSILRDVHRVLCIHLGTPPTEFDWQWNDKDKQFHRDGSMTPQQFAQQYITLPIDDYVCLVHDPRDSNPFSKTYTVQYLGNVVGGEIVKYLNVDVDVMKHIAMRQLCDGQPVWFGCDVGKMMRRDMGIWDAELFDYHGLYDAQFSLTKADRLEYHQTLMTHAMLFTGVDVVDGKPRRWRVENSWGSEDNGREGFYVMNDSWFDEYMFEIAAPVSYLSDDLRTALAVEPTVLPPWDPMGALAR